MQTNHLRARKREVRLVVPGAEGGAAVGVGTACWGTMGFMPGAVCHLDIAGGVGAACVNIAGLNACLKAYEHS